MGDSKPLASADTHASSSHRVEYQTICAWHNVLYILEGIIPMLSAKLSRHSIIQTILHSQTCRSMHGKADPLINRSLDLPVCCDGPILKTASQREPCHPARVQARSQHICQPGWSLATSATRGPSPGGWARRPATRRGSRPAARQRSRRKVP